MKLQSFPDEPPVRRIHQAQSSPERMRMRFAMRFRRCLSLAVVNGTHAILRLSDILISITALILAAPLMTLTALLIRRDGGPAFFKQRRLDFHGREFELLKFRSTGADAEAGLSRPLTQNDPRITPIGRFIRMASIDELPQFFNVLRGDMSIVGPHPRLPHTAVLYSSADRRRLHARPGITCLWEVGDRSNIASHSFRRDLGLLFKTIPAIVRG